MTMKTGEYMDDILSKLLCVFYNIKQRKFRKLEFIPLIMSTAKKLGFTGKFTLDDFGEKRERSKWMRFLSEFLSYFDCDFTETVEVSMHRICVLK